MRAAHLSLATVLVVATGCGGRRLEKGTPQPGVDAAATEVAPPSTEVDAAPDPSDAASDQSDAAQEGGNPVPVDPEISRRWTWLPCGRLLPAGSDAEAVFAADGTLVVRGQDGTLRRYDEKGTPRPETDGGPVASLIMAPDGTAVGVTETPAALIVRPVGATTARFTFGLPQATLCGKKYTFSNTGDYFLAHDQGAYTCIWRVDDGGLVASLPEDASQAAIRGRQLVTLEPRGEDHLVDVVTRDFSGQETARVKLETKLEYPGNALLSPAGDRVASWYPAALWNVDGQALLAIEQTAAEPNPVRPAFTAAGDRVLVANGVFRTADGTRAATLTRLSPLYRTDPLALSPDGGRAITRAYGRASLFDVSAPGFMAMLGPHVRRGERETLETLAISADSVLIATIGGAAFGIRLAPRFEDSSTAWAIFAGDITFIGEISTDGKWATAAGDNRAVFSATDGRLIWPSPAPNDFRCLGSRLTVSPKGTWAAGASYAGTMDVFSLADTTRAAWSPVATLPTACFGSAAFSRDERTLATSAPALYRFDPTGTAWNPVWSHFTGTSPSPPSGLSGDSSSDVRFSPDETLVLVSHCDAEAALRCRATLYDTATGTVARALPALTAPRPSFSPDGSWIVAGSTLLHLPSNDTRSIAPALSTIAAVFTPDGDIVGGSDDGALVRYCRDR